MLASEGFPSRLLPALVPLSIKARPATLEVTSLEQLHRLNVCGSHYRYAVDRRCEKSSDEGLSSRTCLELLLASN